MFLHRHLALVDSCGTLKGQYSDSGLCTLSPISNVSNSFSQLDTTISSVGSQVYVPDGNVISSQGDRLVLCLMFVGESTQIIDFFDQINNTSSCKTAGHQLTTTHTIVSFALQVSHFICWSSYRQYCKTLKMGLGIPVVSEPTFNRVIEMIYGPVQDMLKNRQQVL